MKWRLMPQGVRMVKADFIRKENARSPGAGDREDLAAEDRGSHGRIVEKQEASDLPATARNNVLGNRDLSRQAVVKKSSRRLSPGASGASPVKGDKKRRGGGLPPHPVVKTEVIRDVENQLKNAILVAEERSLKKELKSETSDQQTDPDGVHALFRGKASIEPRLVLLLSSDSVEAECFRLFQTLLSFPSNRKARQAVLMTSTQPGEVLLVGCDLKRPAVEDLFGIGSLFGVEADFADGVPISCRPNGSDIEDIGLPPETVDPQRMISHLFPSETKRISPEWMDRFDERTVILFHAPFPCPPIRPGEAAHTGDALVVIDYGVVPRECSDQLLERIGRDNILGCIASHKKNSKTISSPTYAFARYGKRA